MNKFIKKITKVSPYVLYIFINDYIKSKTGRCEWHIIKYGKLKGIRLWINTKRNSSFLDMINGKYDDFIYDLLSKYKSKKCVIWDIGAHIGFHSLGFARTVGDNGRVLAFEPNVYNVKRLKKNIAGNPDLSGRIKVLEKALSYKKGNAIFITTDDIDSAKSSGGYLSEAMPPLPKDSYATFKSTKVVVDTIDNFLKYNSSSTPNIIKIDVEGAEANVLRGGKEFLKKRNPLIIAEIHNITSMLNVANILINTGYKIEIVDNKDTSVSRCFIVAAKPVLISKMHKFPNEQLI
jgi:FkbM family methyltransferase